MRIARHGMAALFCCIVLCIAFAFPALTWAAGASAPASTPTPKPAEPQPPPDPLGRSTPYGTVIGFLRTVESGDYKTASRYLEGRQSAEEKEQRARDLAVVLNRGVRSSGVELTAAVAGLGVGTIAIAFAAQKTLENLFGTVMVVSDDVVKVGDFCQAGAIEGRVESIGLRSTRIRTLDRTVVSIPNGQLSAMSIGNLARRDKTLFRHTIRLRCETTSGQIRAILGGATDILSGHPRLEPSTVRARLIRLGDAGLELEAFAYVMTQDADVFLQIQEELLLQIMNVIEASGTAIATPPKVTITSDGLGFAVVDRPVVERLAAPAASAGISAPKVS